MEDSILLDVSFFCTDQIENNIHKYSMLGSGSSNGECPTNTPFIIDM